MNYSALRLCVHVEKYVVAASPPPPPPFLAYSYPNGTGLGEVKRINVGLKFSLSHHATAHLLRDNPNNVKVPNIWIKLGRKKTVAAFFSERGGYEAELFCALAFLLYEKLTPDSYAG